MPISTINVSKDAEKSYQPLLLVTLTAKDGTILRLCSIGLNTTEGGTQYGGQNYLGRIVAQNLGALQGHYEGGIDVMSRVSLTVADPDKVAWLLHQSSGFTGASMRIVFVMRDAVAGTYTSDSTVPFEGICSQPSVDAEHFYIAATSSLNLSRRLLPPVPLQRRCPWVNPITTGERAQAANEESIFFHCGETRDLATAPPCDYTAATCTQPTHRAGVEFEVSPSGRFRNYLSGQWIDIQNNPNAQKWGRPIPLVYGTAWVDGITSIAGEGNSTRGEAILCQGEVEAILRVIVNDIELPPANDITGSTNYNVRDPLMRYNVINRGGRVGAPNLDAPWNGNGDPYGGLATILWVLYSKYADPASVPSVRVLVRGPKVRVFSGTGVEDFTREYSDSPAWVLLDLLTRAGVPLSRLDLQTFIDAATYCAVAIDYTDQFGAAATHARFSCSLVLSQRQSASDIIRRLRAGCGARLVQSSLTGKIQLFIDSTLAHQQPSAPSGSNYVTAVSSKLPDGTVANGYAAYLFDKVLRVNGISTLKIAGAAEDPPNRIAFEFTNSEREYAGDSASMIDAQAIQATGRQIDMGLDAAGINTLDQCKRVGRRALAELNRANERGDAGGSEFFTFQHSFGTVRLRPGMICLLSDTQHALSLVPIRIIQIRPGANWTTAEIYAQRHDDDFYLDTYGQEVDPLTNQNPRDRLARPAYPWGPYKRQPIDNDAMVDSTEWTFNLAEDHDNAADGSSLAKLVITGALPVNVFGASLRPPIVERQGTIDTGGTIPGGGWVYYTAVCAVDADDKMSPHSLLCSTAIEAAGSTHKILMDVLDWPAEAVAWVAYIGNTPNKLSKSQEGVGTPALIEFSSYPQADLGMPDTEFDRFRFKVKKIAHGGVWGLQTSAVSGGTLTFTGAAFEVDQWDGRRITLLAKNKGIGDLHVATFLATGNDAENISVTPDPDGIVGVGDVVVMRSLPVDVGADYIEDPLWQNSVSNDGAGLLPGAEIGNLLRIIAGTGRGDVYRIKDNTEIRLVIDGAWIRTPDATSVYVVESPDWAVEQDSDRIDNSEPTAELSFDVGVDNYARQTLAVLVVGLDGGGNEAIEALSPYREIYLWGGLGPVVSTEEITWNAGPELVVFDGLESDIGVTYGVITVQPGLLAEVYEVIAAVSHAPAGSAITLDLHRSEDAGASWLGSILSNPLDIADGEINAQTSEFAADPLLLYRTNRIRLEVSQVGSSNPGSNLSVIVRYRLRIDEGAAAAEANTTMGGGGPNLQEGGGGGFPLLAM